jgi:hypothetical protein
LALASAWSATLSGDATVARVIGEEASKDELRGDFNRYASDQVALARL